MKHYIFLVLGLFSACAVIDNRKSEQVEPLFTVATDTVTVDDFIYAFQKNRPEDSAVYKSEVDDYLELYKKFKLKVAEAKSLGMDTTSAFRQEYRTYMNQLDNSYLQSSNDTDSLVRQAFDRLQSQVNASHILLLAEASASPEDTLEVYNKLVAIRDSIVSQGADFGEMAIKYSEDPSAKQNKGALGFFSVFQMVYPFENAAFETSVDSISEPFRTRFGYHIVKVNDRRANDGRVRVAHIMIRNSDKAEEKVFDIYNQLNAGADWNQLCAANSEDYQSANRGGELAPFSRGQIVQPFSDVAFGLGKPGEISEPIQTPYGWHIIKLIEKLPVDDFNKMQQQLRAQVQRDDRSKISDQKMIEKLAKANNLVENGENIQEVITPGNYPYENSKFVFDQDSLGTLTLFTINDKVFTAVSLYQFINKSSRHQNSKEFLFEQYNQFKAGVLTSYEKAHLAEKYPEYKYLKKEYYDGILLFSIMEDVVWNPASADSLGIENYYQEHKAEFIDSATIEIAIFSSPSKEVIDSIKTLFPDRNSFLSLSKSEKEALLNPNNDTAKVSLQLEFGEYETTGNRLFFEEGVPTGPEVRHQEDEWYYLLPVRLPGEARRLANIRGQLIADYQEFLEAQWIAELSEKYQVKIDEKALKFVYKKLDTK